MGANAPLETRILQADCAEVWVPMPAGETKPDNPRSPLRASVVADLPAPWVVSWFVSQPCHPCPFRMLSVTVARLQVKGREQWGKPHEHCSWLSFGLLRCRVISDGFEI